MDFNVLSYYNLDLSFCLSVPQLLRRFPIWIQFYHTMIYYQFVRVRVREEPQWQGASMYNSSLIIFHLIVKN